MSTCITVLFILFYTAQFGVNSGRPGSTYSFQSVNTNGDVEVVDIIKNGKGVESYQSVDSNGNIISQSISNGRSHKNSFGAREFEKGSPVDRSDLDMSSVPWRSRTFDEYDDSSDDYDDYDDYDYDGYEDNDERGSISYFSRLMKQFINKISARYNKGMKTSMPGIPEYLFFHYYSRANINPSAITVSPWEITKCVKTKFCLKNSKPICSGLISYCITPIEQTKPCDPQFRNGNLPCLTTSIAGANGTEGPIIVPCIATLKKSGKRSQYCVTVLMRNMGIKGIMNRVNMGMKAGQEQFQQGMATLKQALSGIRNLGFKNFMNFY